MITETRLVPIFERRIFTRKVIYRLFQLNVGSFPILFPESAQIGTFQKCKNAHACALRDYLGVSRPFVSDTSPKCIDRERPGRTPWRDYANFHLLSVLSYDNLRVFFRTLRRSKDVIFHEENIHKILLDLFRK